MEVLKVKYDLKSLKDENPDLWNKLLNYLNSDRTCYQRHNDFYFDYQYDGFDYMHYDACEGSLYLVKDTFTRTKECLRSTESLYLEILNNY